MNRSIPQICLGSVQFGMNYGLTNTLGKTDVDIVGKIIREASSTGVMYIDTAQSYGQAEQILGLYPEINNFQIISKLSKQAKQAFTIDDIQKWEHGFQKTCKNLQISHLYGFLLHDSSDLIKPGSEYLVQWLNSLKARNLVGNIGVSIYNAKEVDQLDLSFLDVVQLPLSIYDQRCLANGLISNLRSKEVKIFARSIYLQGLLLLPSTRWPDWIPSGIRNHHKRLEKLAVAYELNLIDIALNFIKCQTEIEAFAVGVTSLKEYHELVASYDACHMDVAINWSELAIEDTTFLDPRMWPKQE